MSEEKKVPTKIEVIYSDGQSKIVKIQRRYSINNLRKSCKIKQKEIKTR